MPYRKNFFLAVACLVSVNVFAAIELPSVIGNNMVLQQLSHVALWGKSLKNATVSVSTSWDNASYAVKATPEGDWKVFVRTPSAGGPYRVTFSDGEKLVLSNILIGEVWICSGQSNMEMPVEGFRNQPFSGSNETLMEADNPRIRLLRLEHDLSITPLHNARANGWQECNAGSVKKFSAVGYLYAKMLQERLKVPVGIIGAYWGGTVIEAWMSAGSLHEFPEITIPKDTAGVNKNTPTVLFNAMISPLIGYGIKGMIWYQGEQNRLEPALYEKLLPAMVKDWRKAWNTGDFPFYYVQIAPYKYGDHRQLVPYLREAQWAALDRIPAAGMVVSIDVGDEFTIHPPDKKTISRRLAYWALANVYGRQGLLYQGPVYRSMSTTGDTVNIQFDHAGNGLTSFGKELGAFEMAAADKVFYPANAIITGKGIKVSSGQVKNPVAVRYAFRDWVRGDLYSTEGLPVAPFRTDDWEAEPEKK